MIGFFYLALGISLLYFSGDWLVDGSTSLARHMKVKPFVIALTLVAFGTSAPELAISVHSALKGYEGITLGNIVGSNIANVLFALPLAFLIKIPKKCDLKSIDHFYLLISTFIYIFIILFVGSFNKISSSSFKFRITDEKASILVTFKGILPDLFREGQGAVIEGAFVDINIFNATNVFAKHDENYMPASIKEDLKDTGYWNKKYK